MSSLVEAANDKSDEVRDAVCRSLCSLGKKKPNIVLSACSSYLQKHSKLSIAHRILILKCIHKVCQDKLDSIPQSLALQLTKQAAEEMTTSKDLVPDWQTAASGIIVALGSKYCQETMEILLSYFQPGVLPHFFVLQTLANLAGENVYGVVPFLKAVLGTLLPMLGLMRQDNMKWVSSFALAKFSEAITDYLVNIDKAPDPTVKAEVFDVELSMAYDIILTWIQTKEPKLRITIVEAIGHMASLLPKEKLAEQLPRLISTILGLYKRHSDSYILTQSLFLIMEVSIKNHRNELEVQIDHVIQALFPQICTFPDYLKPSMVKNHNEILRCFCLISQTYPNSVVQLLMTSLENNFEKSRIGGLTVLRHIINTSDMQIRDRMPELLNALKLILNDNNNKVKKMLSHVIVALAHHGYLEDEKGPQLIEFLISQCSLRGDSSKTKHGLDSENSDEALRTSSENILYILTTTVPRIERVLWPHLLVYLLPEKYQIAVSAVSKNSTYLANKLREENAPEYEIDFSVHPELPGPAELFSRLIVLVGCCGSQSQRANVLQLTKSLSPLINKNIVPLCDTKIPEILKQLSDSKTMGIIMWENIVLDFLMSTLVEVDKEEWAKKVCKYFAKHLDKHPQPSMKGFSMKCIGVALQKINDSEFISLLLDKVFASVEHAEEVEREGCATAFGKTASVHLELVLMKLESLKKVDGARRSSGIFSFFMEPKIDHTQELSKATVIMCYGSISRYISATLLVPRLETPILNHISPFFQLSKNPIIKLSLLRAIDEIAQAVHESSKTVMVQFESRKDLIQNVLNILKEEPSAYVSPVKIMVLDCVTSLIKLDPPLVGHEKENCLRTCLESVYHVPEPEEEQMKKLMIAALVKLNQFLKTLLCCDLTPDNLFLIITSIESWLQSVNLHERIRSASSVLMLLQFYLDNVALGVGKPPMFGPLGAILARLVPRCTDSILTVRQLAIESIYVTFQISGTYDGYTRDHLDPKLEQLLNLKDDIITENPTVLYSLTKEIGQLLAAKLPVHQVTPFLHALFEQILDNSPSSSCGVCIVFNAIVKERGTELHQQVDILMKLLIYRMSLITCTTTKKSLMQILHTLASHHLMAVTNFLLNSQMDNAVIECWQDLAQDTALSSSILENFLELFARVSPFMQYPDPRNKKETVNMASPQILAVVLAVKEMFQQAEMQETCLKYFPKTFAALLLLCGSLVDSYTSPTTPTESEKGNKTWPPLIILEKKVEKTPCRSVVEAFQAFLLCSNQESIVKAVTEKGCWVMMESAEHYPDAYSCLARSLCHHAPQYLAGVVSHLNPSMTSSLIYHRVAVAAFFAELINQRCCGDSALLELLLNSLVNCLVDNSHTMRKLCIRGLGYIGKVGADQYGMMEWFGVHKYSTTVLSAMLAGLDDKDDPNADIALESMNGLSKVLAEIDPSLVKPLLVNIILRIRICFENVRPEIRTAAFMLFGDLARFGEGDNQSPMAEQIHNNLVTLLLHLRDEDEDVIKACKHALRHIGPLVNSEAMNNMFQKHMKDDAVLYYEEFISDLIKIMVVDLSEKVSLYVVSSFAYFKSRWPILQGNVAIFIGYMLSSLASDVYVGMAKESIYTALTLLLKSAEKDVRVKAAESISLCLQNLPDD